MLTRLKLSSRIIIIFIAVLVIIASGNLIFMSVHAEMVPNAYAHEESERYFYFNELKNIDIQRGFWNIKLIPSERNYIKVAGGMRLLNYFVTADQNDTGITISLSDSIKEDYRYSFKAEAHSNSIQNIHLKSLASMLIDSADFNKLNVHLEDYSKLQMKDCSIKDVKINLHNLCAFETEACDIENLRTSMYDSSFAIIYSAANIVPEIQQQFSMLMIYDDITGEYSSNISDSVSRLISLMPEYIDGVKWLSPFTKPILIESEDLTNMDSVSYLYAFWEKPLLTPVRSYFINPYYDHTQKIYFNNTEFIEGYKTYTHLIYKRGFLNSIDIQFYYDSLAVLPKDKILAKLLDKYGQPVDSSLLEYDPFLSTYYYTWHDSTGSPANIFTKIKFRYFNENYAWINITSSYFNSRDIPDLYRDYWSYDLSRFLTY